MNFWEKLLNIIPSIVKAITESRRDNEIEKINESIANANRARNTATVNFDNGVSNDDPNKRK